MRYSKQEKFPPLLGSAQILSTKTVAVVGVGGLGSHSAEYITRMGIGKIILIDDDFVEESNLARQGTYTYKDAIHSVPKVNALHSQLAQVNPDIEIVSLSTRLNHTNIDSILRNVDLVLDGTDNMTTRYLINDFCFSHQIPWIYASATSSMSTTINFIPGRTPCFRCLFGDVQEDLVSCDINGIILPALTMATSIQVTEGLKILLNKEPSPQEFRYNVWTREESSMDLSLLHNEDCECKKGFRKEYLGMYFLCGGDSIQVNTGENLKSLYESMKRWGFHITKENERFVEAKSEESRIMAYDNGKMIFYNINKNQVQNWFKRG